MIYEEMKCETPKNIDNIIQPLKDGCMISFIRDNDRYYHRYKEYVYSNDCIYSLNTFISGKVSMEIKEIIPKEMIRWDSLVSLHKGASDWLKQANRIYPKCFIYTIRDIILEVINAQGLIHVITTKNVQHGLLAILHDHWKKTTLEEVEEDMDLAIKPGHFILDILPNDRLYNFGEARDIYKTSKLLKTLELSSVAIIITPATLRIIKNIKKEHHDILVLRESLIGGKE